MIELALSLMLARPDTPGTDELFRFDAGDEVEVFDTERFRVHFTRAGDHAVPLDDDALVGVVGVPDHVEEIGAVYEDVLTFYTATLGYRAPLGDGGTVEANDARFDVYLVDFNFNADGAFRAESCIGNKCAGFMVQENDFAGYGYPSASFANRLLASHEFFHAVQAAYDVGQGAVMSEGTAVWASEQFDSGFNDMEGFGLAYLDETDRPLNADGSGPVDPFTYGSAIFFDHIAQAHGPEVVRALWEAVDEDTAGSDVDWFDVLDGVIAAAAGGSGFADDFVTFATSTLGDVTPTDTVTLPFSTGSFLVFIASWHTLAFNPAGRPEVRVALVGEGIDVDGMQLVVAPDGETPEIVSPRASNGDGGVPVVFDVTRDSTQQFFRVQIINTRQDGNGSRPRLCIGDTEEVDACIADELAAVPDAGPAPDGGDVDVEPPSCACGAGRAARGDVAFALAFLAFLALLARMRRR